MAIRYKVVTTDRKSCIVRDEDYVLSYPKGEVVTARKDTVGVMCFLTRKDAKEFVKLNHSLFKKGAKILRVETNKPGFVPKYTSYVLSTANWLKDFYQNKSDCYTVRHKNNCISGTMCYRSVKVLD